MKEEERGHDHTKSIKKQIKMENIHTEMLIDVSRRTGDERTSI